MFGTRFLNRRNHHFPLYFPYKVPLGSAFSVQMCFTSCEKHQEMLYGWFIVAQWKFNSWVVNALMLLGWPSKTWSATTECVGTPDCLKTSGEAASSRFRCAASRCSEWPSNGWSNEIFECTFKRSVSRTKECVVCASGWMDKFCTTWNGADGEQPRAAKRSAFPISEHHARSATWH